MRYDFLRKKPVACHVVKRSLDNWRCATASPHQVTRFDIHDDFEEFLKNARNKGKVYKPSPGAKVVELVGILLACVMPADRRA